jgi:hypothetical protein
MTKIWLASFDIGKKNFAFYIEETDSDLLTNIQNISFPQRYLCDGTPSPSFKNILKQVTTNGKTILFKNNDITSNCRQGKYIDSQLFHNMTELLDMYKPMWDKCSCFVIEQQMSFGKQRNTMALKLGQHCYSYFTFMYGRFKDIIEFQDKGVRST